VRQRFAFGVLAENNGTLHLASLRPAPMMTSFRRTVARCSLGNFDADGVFCLGLVRRCGRSALQMQGEIVAERGDFVDAHAGLEGDLVLRDDRAGVDADDLDVEVEVLEGLFEDGRLFAQLDVVLFEGEWLRIVEERQRRQFVVLEVLLREARQARRLIGKMSGTDSSSAGTSKPVCWIGTPGVSWFSSWDTIPIVSRSSFNLGCFDRIGILSHSAFQARTTRAKKKLSTKQA